MLKPHCEACYETRWGEYASVESRRQSTKSNTSAGQVPLATHRQHGIEEVSDEGSTVLHSLLGLGEISHRVTWQQRQMHDFSAHPSIYFPTGVKTLCHYESTLMPHPGPSAEMPALAQRCLAMTVRDSGSTCFT